MRSFLTIIINLDYKSGHLKVWTLKLWSISLALEMTVKDFTIRMTHDFRKKFWVRIYDFISTIIENFWAVEFKNFRRQSPVIFGYSRRRSRKIGIFLLDSFQDFCGKFWIHQVLRTAAFTCEKKEKFPTLGIVLRQISIVASRVIVYLAI